MVETLGFLVLAAFAGLWQFFRLRHRVRVLRQPLTSLAQYRTSFSAGASHLVRAEWVDCPICECASVDRLAATSICTICDWEYSSGMLDSARDQARANFEMYGSVDSPEENRQWDGAAPDIGVLEAKRAAVDVCRQAREGAITFGEALHELALQEQFIRAAHDRHADDLSDGAEHDLGR